MSDYTMKLVAVNTVSENLSKYSKRDGKRAENVKELIKSFNSIDEQKLKLMLNKSMIKGCDLVGRDVSNAIDILGKNLTSLKAKSKNRKGKHVPFDEVAPANIDIILHMDVMHIRDKHKYLVAVCNPIDLIMIKRLKSSQQKYVREATDAFIKQLRSKGFYVREIRSDPGKDIQAALSNLPDIRYNPSGTGAHEPVVERKIQTIRERLRANDFDCKPITVADRLLDYQLHYVVQRMNMELSNNRLDQGIPWVAFTGLNLDLNTDFSLRFLDYVQAFDRTAVELKKSERTIGAIALRRVANSSGSWLFYGLKSKRTFVADKWTKLPMPDTVIDILNRMNHSHNQTASEVTDTEEADDIASVAGERVADIRQSEPQLPTSAKSSDLKIPDNNAPEVVDEKITISDKKRRAMEGTNRFINNGKKPERRSERIRLKRGTFNISVSEAKKTRPNEAKEAIRKELSNLHHSDNIDNPFKVFRPVHIKDLDHSERKQIIHSTLFLKDKTDAEGIWTEFKGRLVVNETAKRVQNKSEIQTSSPTVDFGAVALISALSLSLAEKLKDKRNLRMKTERRVFDIKQAYTNAAAKRKVHIRISREIADELCDMYPVYKQYRQSDGTIIVRLIQALYGTVDAGRLWYDEFKGYLMSLGFTANAYESCIFNRKEKDETVTTILLYVDDGKMICSNEEVANEVVKHIESRYGEMKIQTGDVLNYLGCKFDYSEGKSVLITQRGHIDKLLRLIPVTKSSSTPAAKDLLTINEDSKLLEESKRKSFHSAVYLAQFIAMRTRPDCLLTVNFLSTRCTKATEQDWYKLIRLVQYLKGTRDLGLKLSLSEDGKIILSSYIDASLGAHADGKGQSGLFSTLGKGSAMSKSSKQKINAKSAHETEIIALSDYINKIVWCRLMIAEQGFEIGPAVIYQDNKGVLEVCKRGQNGNSRTKHIALRYNLVRDLVERGEVVLKYCPTKLMVADILTKPLQGKLFRDLRDILLGYN
jgi:hypothetical protein